MRHIVQNHRVSVTVTGCGFHSQVIGLIKLSSVKKDASLFELPEQHFLISAEVLCKIQQKYYVFLNQTPDAASFAEAPRVNFTYPASLFVLSHCKGNSGRERLTKINDLSVV